MFPGSLYYQSCSRHVVGAQNFSMLVNTHTSVPGLLENDRCFFDGSQGTYHVVGVL